MKICKDCNHLIKKVRQVKGEKARKTTFNCDVDGELLNKLNIEIVECNNYFNPHDIGYMSNPVMIEKADKSKDK
jgi:hypothetical protein